MKLRNAEKVFGRRSPYWDRKEVLEFVKALEPDDINWSDTYWDQETIKMAVNWVSFLPAEALAKLHDTVTGLEAHHLVMMEINRRLTVNGVGKVMLPKSWKGESNA